MLSRKNLKRNDFVSVNENIKLGVPNESKIERKFVRLWLDFIGIGNFVPIFSGEYLKILKPPHIRGGVNVVEIEDGDNVVGYVYWCELRASCNKVVE